MRMWTMLGWADFVLSSEGNYSRHTLYIWYWLSAKTEVLPVCACTSTLVESHLLHLFFVDVCTYMGLATPLHER